jgi:Spy/CpxP family protein refolding chaperone
MRRPTIGAIPVILMFAGSAAAQHSGAPSHQMLAQTCTTEFEKTVADGRGFGMAFVADQQGYPGPSHVLELRDQLKLTPEQEARTQALLTAMFAESRPKSARLLDAERKLRHLFATGHVDEGAMRAAVENVERARADARLVHLSFHLKTRDLLTEEQRRLYHEARWSGPGPGASSQHGHGHAPTK